MSPRPGPVRMLARKWPDRPHWEFDGLVLGEDRHGVWVGAPSGTLMERPGASFVTDQPQVCLVPRRAAFLATFYAPGGLAPFDVYVDVTTVPLWQDGPPMTVTAVDLDLDVVRGWTGRVWVDDEDEFAAHRVHYPADLVRLAATSCATVRAAVESGRPPYDGSAGAWLATLDETTRTGRAETGRAETGRAETGRAETGAGMTSEQTAYDVVVHGEVQGVFFRDSCRTEARSAGVTGWVRNEYDGTVRAHVEGSPDALETMLAWLRHGPSQARVQHVDVQSTDSEGHTGFEVR